MAETPDEIAGELYGAPFDEFIARRDAAAKELRSEKRREDADAVKKLRKPALSAWAVNQLQRSEADRVEGLLAAGAALRQAKSGDALRDATHDERAAVDDLAERAVKLLSDAGHTVSDKTASEVRDTLHAAAADDAAREMLSVGRLVEPQRAVGLGVFEGGAVGGAEKAERGRQKAESKTEKRKAEASKRKAEAEQRKAEERARRERVKAAREALRGAERELAQAQKAVDAARAELEDAEG